MAFPKKGSGGEEIRHLRGHNEFKVFFRWQDTPSTVPAMSDSDWAGNKETGHVTSCIIVKWRDHVLSCSCRQQKTTAAVGVRNLLDEMGLRVVKRRQCDARAARGVWNTVGVGEVRHLDLKHLGVQEFGDALTAQCRKGLQHSESCGFVGATHNQT